MKLLWIFTCALVVGFCEGAAKNINGKPLHLHMTKREVEHYFGTSDHPEVPEYDIVLPYHSNDDGGFVSFNLRGGGRQRRSLADLSRPNYRLSAFGKDLHLKLVRNDWLKAPDLQFEEKLPSGRTSRSPVPENTFYLGHVASDPDSLVAVSNDDGLKGLIRHKKDAMFIQPLPDHLAKHFRTKRDTQPHLIYKADAFTIRTMDEGNIELFPESGAFNSDSPGARAERAVSPLVGNVSDYKFLEVGLMADNLVSTKYGADKIANHLLLIGNIAAGMFLDKSIGKKKVVFIVKKIGTVYYDDLDVNEDSSTGQKMSTMAKYMREKDKTAVDVYSFIVSNAIGGLAPFNRLCKEPGVGTISGDTGLQCAGTVVHEIGHTMGLVHDNTAECPSGTNIMAYMLPEGPKAHTWSPCSRKKLQEFLNGPRSNCLNKPVQPLETPLEWRDKLPGELVSADQQCVYHFGNKSSHCRQMITTCAALWCSTGGYVCASRKVPALDGSSCGGRNWCIRGKCVDNGSPYIDGGWSEWSDFVPCTMKCGGGITYRERTCTNPAPQNGGNPCEGSTESEIRTCNTEPCSAEQKSYRQEACENWDTTAAPKYSAEQPCILHCKKDGSLKTLGPVKNGARCTQFSLDLDVCVDGECKDVGCDHRFESGVKNDYCGVCAGNRTSCLPQRGDFTYAVKRGVSYLIVELPIGTTRALFAEMAETYNRIGVQNSSGSFLIPPKSRTWSKIEAAGAEVTHLASRKGRDQLFVLGPTNAVLRIVYIRIFQRNPGVRYMMYKPLEARMPPGSQATYDWRIPENDEWSDCSAECAGGTQTRTVSCARSDDRSPVGDQWCSGNKPNSERECNEQPCQPEWHLSRWEDCSKTCGSGVQTRSLVCHQKVKDLGFQQMSDDSCDDGSKPTSDFERYCREIKCAPVWRAQQVWSQCSTSCDPGIATRKVLCVQTDETGQDVVVPDILCTDDKPPSQKACNLDNGCAPLETTCPPVHLCKNGATCVDDPAGYQCACTEGYQGYFCEVQSNPCDGSPCLNGRVCVPDDEVVQKYRCEAPPSYEIGCFRFSSKLYSVNLGDLKDLKSSKKKSQQWGLADTKPIIERCRQLAYDQGYKQFATTHDRCVTVSKKAVKYVKRVASNSCFQGVGLKKALFAYSFEPPPSYTDLGCYNERSGKKGALRETLADLKAQPDDVCGQTIVEQCAYMARDRGYDYFAVTKRRVCISSKDAANKYKIHQEITEDVLKFCKDGVGLSSTAMQVYHIQ